MSSMRSKAAAAVARSALSRLTHLKFMRFCEIGSVKTMKYLMFVPSWAGEPDGDADDTLSPPSSQQMGLVEATAGTLTGCVRSDEAAVIDNMAGGSETVETSAGGEGGGVAAAEPPQLKRARTCAPTHSSLPLSQSRSL